MKFMPNAKLVARLADHIVGWPTVYGSDRKNRAILKEALEEIVRLSLVIDSIGWQPIDTAPKDGTVVDLWAGERIINASWRSPEGVWDMEEFRQWCASELFDWRHGGSPKWEISPIGKTPTHWMPVPADPSIAILDHADCGEHGDG